MRAERVRGDRGRRDARGGFLLVEALAVLAISAAILVGLASLTQLLLRQADGLAARTERLELRERTLAALSRDIRALARIRFEGPDRERFVFAGTPDRLLFAREASAEMPAEAGAVAVLLQSADESGQVRLLRAESPLLPGMAGFDDLRFGPVRTLLDRDPARIRFAYVAAATEKTPELILDAWPPESPPPAAVRIGLADPATGELVSSLRVAILHEAEPGCARAKTHWCSRTDLGAEEEDETSVGTILNDVTRQRRNLKESE